MYSITFQQLEAFIEVAEMLNITVVAENNYVSQAAMSKMIQRLEEGINVKLFNRNTRGITLTPEGQLFYDRILFPFESICNAVEEVRELKEGNRNVLKIGLPSTVNINVEYSHISDVITEYKNSHPEVHVEVDIYEASHLRRMLNLGNIDAAFLQSFMFQSSSGFNYVPISHLSTCIAVREDNPAIKGGTLNMELLAKQPMFRLQTAQTGNNIDQYVKSVGLNSNGIKTMPNFESLMYAVAHNDGFALIGKIRPSGFENICVFPANDGKYTHDLCMAWRSDNESENLQKFVKYICKNHQLKD